MTAQDPIIQGTTKQRMKWRVLWAVMIMGGFLTAVPGFALTVDVRPAVPEVKARNYEAVADRGAETCRSLLEGNKAADTSKATDTTNKAAAKTGQHHATMPAALVGYMLGAQFATGPRDNAGYIRAAANGADSSVATAGKVHAIAAYRRCRAAHMLEALSH